MRQLSYTDTTFIKVKPRCPQCFYIDKVMDLHLGVYQQNLAGRCLDWGCSRCRIQFTTPEQAVLLIPDGDRWKQVRI